MTQSIDYQGSPQKRVGKDVVNNETNVEALDGRTNGKKKRNADKARGSIDVVPNTELPGGGVE